MKAVKCNEEELKDCGIEWIGIIPDNWQVQKCKYVMDFINGYAFQSDDFTNYGEYDVIRIGDIVDGKVNFDSCTKVNNNNGIDNYLIKEDDLLIAMSGATVGKIAYINDNRIAYINQRVGIMRANSINARFLFYCFNTPKFIEYVNLQSPGSAQPNISMYVMDNFYIPKIDFACQIVIANYLDDRCSKIDAIIAEANASIEEYKELKQAVIYEAVTKGLDKNVEMKDSGIEWIGNIPKSWEMKKIKYVADFNPKVTIDYDVNQNVGYVPMDAVKFGYMEPLESAIYKLSTGLTQFQNNDIVMAKVTPCFENGEIAIAENLAQEVGFGSSELFVYRANSINRKFLFYYLQHIGFKEMAASTMTGTGGLKRVSSYFARNAEITYPSVAEQQEIVNYLDKNCEGIDSLITEKQSLIEDLEAYKKSLIYEVVTGKRKVVA